MSKDISYLYQMYEILLKKAIEQEQAGKRESARLLYLQAAESIAKIASANSGRIQENQLKEATVLLEKAKLLKSDPMSGKTPQNIGTGTSSKNEDQTNFTPSPVPNVSFDDIAGLDDVKREVRERIIQPMKNPELYAQFKIKPGGGILMFGLPGTGKTMIARAIAHEVNAPFFHIRSSDLKDKWVGSSERNIAALFERARQEKASVLFFDEFDGIGGKLDQSNTHTRGVLSELKSQMDGFDKDGPTIILMLAATNHPWDIDTAFLRSGRFSKMIYIPLPDEETRMFLIHQQLKGVPVDEIIDFNNIVAITDGFNGADIVQLCYQIKIMAATRSDELKQLSLITQDDISSVAESFRSTVVKSDIDKMKEFMRQNDFQVPNKL